MRQLVTESVLLALAGGVGGGIVAVWAADLVVAYFATAVGLEPLRPDYLVDWRVFGFIATTAMAAGVLTGIAPALRSTRIELARAIGSGGRNADGTVAGRRLSPPSPAVAGPEPGGAPFEVIGVVRDAHMSPASPFDRPPFVLYPFGFRAPRGAVTLHVHTEEPLSAALPAVADTIRRHDPTLAILDAGGMNDMLRSNTMLVIVRLGAALIGSFGLLGLLLAAVGLYGVVSHAVAQRKQEFGIRSALGATSAAILRLALRRGVVLSILGLALGAVSASGLARLTAGFLVGVSPSDPADVVGRESAPSISPALMLGFHQRIGSELGEHFDAIPGQFRTDERFVGPYKCPQAADVRPLVNLLCEWLQEEFGSKGGGCGSSSSATQGASVSGTARAMRLPRRNGPAKSACAWRWVPSRTTSSVWSSVARSAWPVQGFCSGCSRRSWSRGPSPACSSTLHRSILRHWPRCRRCCCSWRSAPPTSTQAARRLRGPSRRPPHGIARRYRPSNPFDILMVRAAYSLGCLMESALLLNMGTLCPGLMRLEQRGPDRMVSIIDALFQEPA